MLLCLTTIAMALSLHSSNSSLYPPYLQSHDYPSSYSCKTVRFKIYCGYCHTIQINATKTKRKPRPNFFEQIRHKWALKIPSSREKFPWQEQREQQEVGDEKEGEEEEEEELVETSGLAESELQLDASPSVNDHVSFTLPDRVVTAPWGQGYKPRKAHLDSPPVQGEIFLGFVQDCENDAVNSVVDKKENVGKEVDCDKKLKEAAKFDAIPIGLTGFEKKPVFKDSKDVIVSKREKTFVGNGEVANVQVSDDGNGASVELPWVGEGEVESVEEDKGRKRSNTELAERMLPEHELKRLRNVALRMLERIKVGASGITQDLVDAIHEKWRIDEVVKLKFEEPLSCNMRRTHELLESRTGGLVIWRSGSSVVLYRGMTYKFRCVRLYSKQNVSYTDLWPRLEEKTSDATHNVTVENFVRTTKSFIPDASKYLKNLSEKELMDFTELNQLLDELGPRFKDWCGRDPLPVDADLLPAMVPNYKTPFRLLPYGVKRNLKNKEMTVYRRLARTMPPHFALGRNRELQGLAKAIVKLWERSALAKIAIKRGVLNTHNERMAEELKRLTGGTLLSRNKEYIVFYRGNDFLPPPVTETLEERQKLTYLQQDEEEQARRMASVLIGSDAKITKGPVVAGTLAETIAATSRWGNQPSSQDVQEMIRDSSLARHASLAKYLRDKLAIAKGKLKTAERALVKVQEKLDPTGLPTDLETITNEERFLFRKMGLSMKPFLLLGRRGVYAGTIQNMHLHWKYRELVKILVKGKSFAQVKHIAINLEAESGGVLVSVDKTTKGYAIVVYRGKNYVRPLELRPMNLLTKRQALAKSIELQRCEALKYYISDLEERFELVNSELKELEAGKTIDVAKTLNTMLDGAFSDHDIEEDGGREAFLEA